MVLQRIIKPKTQRAKRALQHKEPKLVENTKSAMFVRGQHASEQSVQALKDLCALKKPDAVLYKRKNALRPFEDETSLEFFSQKTDASLFAFASHSKKRPHNLVIGRLFDHHILDMVELGLKRFKPTMEFSGAKCALGAKPCLVFSGEIFERNLEYQRLKSLLVDFFRGPVVENIRLAGLEHVVMFTATDGVVYMRNYKILLKKSGSKTPRIELDEIGPSMDLELRRTKLANDDLFKLASKQPKEVKPKKTKNVAHDVFGTKTGRIHMTKQNLSTLQLRKMKGLKRSRDDRLETDADVSATKQKK